MAIHANLARRALSQGHAAEHFTLAAQKHANAAWFYLIAAGLVWYFASWQWAMIPLALTET